MLWNVIPAVIGVLAFLMVLYKVSTILLNVGQSTSVINIPQCGLKEMENCRRL